MSAMMWLSICFMFVSGIVWAESIYNKEELSQENKEIVGFLFTIGLIIFITEQWIIPFFKLMPI